MFATVNVAIGVSAFFTTIIGLGIFFFTVFSLNKTIILAGLVLTSLFALGIFAVLCRSIPRLPPKTFGAVGRTAMAVAHAGLLAANVIVVGFAMPLIYGALFRPSLSERLPVGGSTVVAAIAASSVLSVGILLARVWKPAAKPH